MERENGRARCVGSWRCEEKTITRLLLLALICGITALQGPDIKAYSYIIAGRPSMSWKERV